MSLLHLTDYCDHLIKRGLTFMQFLITLLHGAGIFRKMSKLTSSDFYLNSMSKLVLHWMSCSWVQSQISNLKLISPWWSGFFTLLAPVEKAVQRKKFAHTYKSLPVVVGTCPSQMKLMDWILTSSDGWRRWRHLCLFLQMTAEKFGCSACIARRRMLKTQRVTKPISYFHFPFSLIFL